MSNADFDFLLGHWTIENRRLQHRLQGNDAWDTFEASARNQALPAGIGNYDDFMPGAWRQGYVGMSLRIFNPQTALWSIYWLDNETGGLHASGLLRPPVVGRFDDGVGLFEGEDELDGKPIKVRYRWCDIGPDHARWEQSMSDDGGATWEMNWRMLFRRVQGA